jgi:hypothetical protein
VGRHPRGAHIVRVSEKIEKSGNGSGDKIKRNIGGIISAECTEVQCVDCYWCLLLLSLYYHS